MQQYVSTNKFYGGEFKYKDLVFLQRSNNGSHTSCGQPFNWKMTFSSLLTKPQATFFTVELFCGQHLHAPLKQDRSHFKTLYFDFYAHQSTATDLATGICNAL